jgi:hypothetical protein
MRLYVRSIAPNALKVAVFLLERGIGLVGWGAIEARPGPGPGRWLREVGARPNLAPLHALAGRFDLRAP